MAATLTFSIDAAYEHLLRADRVLAVLIDRVGPYEPRPRADPFAALLRTILFQQLAGAAATAIQRRLYSLFGDAERPPTPAQVLTTTEDDLRAVGVSRQKALYIRDLALHVADGSLDFAALETADDATVTESLTAVKGLGEWSAHMFLMFHLGRPDVLPTGDLGVRNGMKRAYGLPETPTPARAKEIGAPWAPYRTVGSWYMWRVGEPVAPDI